MFGLCFDFCSNLLKLSFWQMTVYVNFDMEMSVTKGRNLYFLYMPRSVLIGLVVSKDSLLDPFLSQSFSVSFYLGLTLCVWWWEVGEENLFCTLQVQASLASVLYAMSVASYHLPVVTASNVLRYCQMSSLGAQLSPADFKFDVSRFYALK
jgi:hypothetical protein